MTERLYYTSDATECPARVVNCLGEADGRYAIELDRTLFHPQGGGQPADRGWIGELAVESVAARGESIVHIVAQPLPSGEVAIRVDADARRLHARLHSAGHLIGQAGERFGWRPIKAHHWPGEGRITFAPGADPQTLEQGALQAELQRLIAANLPRRQLDVDGVRQVGFGDLPVYGCGGTHVASLSELGAVTITAVKMKKGQLIVQYEMG